MSRRANPGRDAILKWSLLASVGLLWTGVIIACGNERQTETRDTEDSVDTPTPAPEPGAEPTKEPPPPPPPREPTAAAGDGGSSAADGVAATADDEVPEDCGGRGKPMCPLQGYMKRTVIPAMKAGRGLDVELAKVANWAPDPSWNEGAQSWRAAAEAGVEAARASDTTKIKASCKACHTAWQKRYRAEFRRRPVPTN